MGMKVIIATSKGPGNNFEAICKAMRHNAVKNNLAIDQGILWTHGAGCTNLCYELVGDETEAERFNNWLTMELMPARWCTTNDDLPDHDINDIEVETVG